LSQVAGGKPGTPATWDKIVQAHGRDNLLVPELKDPGIDVGRFADNVHENGIRDNVIVQTFDYGTARELAANGLHTLYLATESTAVDPEDVAADGIEYIGPSKATPAEKISAMMDAGLNVWVWTVNDPAAAHALLETGIDGLFTDDPWTISAYLETATR
jgi:glycerophosphoryl diester phosphodiesterase